MRLAVLTLVLGLFGSVIVSDAIGQVAPLEETRGVWFATVLRDGGWPQSTSDSAQKQEDDLRDRIRHAHDLGLNTFVYQAVARGDAQYQSTRLPWSAQLRGAGVDPGYDPLAVAIDECHRLGMELHAWINVFRVGDIGTVSQFESQSNPGHVYYENPGWVQNRNGQLWIDPSSPEARAWLVANVEELVAGYDVDAIHFDFIRYANGGFNSDLANFQFDARGFSDIDDWRRDNVTEFVRDVSASIMATYPWVKIGSAPFGNYENFDGAWPAAWALTDVFQESRKWLADGIHDYLAPQLYFDIGRAPEPSNTFDSPDFAFLVEDWVTNSSNKPIFAGHGPYKSIVLEELDTQIQLTRTENTGGQFYFRYDHIKNFDFSSSYPTSSLPAAMRHRFEALAPSVAIDVTATAGSDNLGNGSVTLDWTEASGSADDPLRGYAIFRRLDAAPDENSGEDLLDFVWTPANSFVDTFPTPTVPNYAYSVVSVSRLGINAQSTGAVFAQPVGLATFETPVSPVIESIHPNPATDQITITYSAGSNPSANSNLTVFVVDALGREVIRSNQPPQSGRNEFVIQTGELASGLYLATVQSGATASSAPFVVLR